MSTSSDTKSILPILELLLSENSSPNKVKRVFEELNKLPIESLLEVLHNAGFDVKTHQQIRQEIIRPLYEPIIARFSAGEMKKPKKSVFEPIILTEHDYYNEAKKIGVMAKSVLAGNRPRAVENGREIQLHIKKLKARAAAFRFSVTGKKVDSYLDSLNEKVEKHCGHKREIDRV